jgi:uncharacterized protein (DUF934 family)
MMALIRNGAITDDFYTSVPAGSPLPARGALLVALPQWRAWRAKLVARHSPTGVRLTCGEHPEEIAADLGHLNTVALEFPNFRDGRAYSYARLLRDRYGYSGELRAVGEVLVDQLLYMHRVGFDSFELAGDDPEGAYRAALGEFGVFYQPAAASQLCVWRQRHGPAQEATAPD